MEDCLFCKIIAGEIPSNKIYEDDNVYAFEDINPMAKIHWLFIHKKHTKNINEIVDTDPEQFQHIYQAINKVSQEKGLVEPGFRVVTNLGENAGQTVFHTHFHVLSGERLGKFGS